MPRKYASLVQSAVQKAMQDQAEREEAEKATKDTDGDGILDIEQDENGDGVRDIAGAAPGGRRVVARRCTSRSTTLRSTSIQRHDQPDRSYFGSE